MKTTLLPLCLTLLAAPAAWGFFPEAGNGTEATELRQVAAFDRIRADSAVDVEVQEGAERKVEVLADSNLLTRITTEVHGGELVVDSRGSMRPRTAPRVRVWLPRLSAVKLTGSGDARVRGTVPDRDLALESHGSGDVSFEGPARRLRAELHGSGDAQLRLSSAAARVELTCGGSGDVELTGPGAAELQVSARGSGDVRARTFTAASAKLRSSGSGDVEARVEGGRVELSSSGSGNIRWWGDAAVAAQAASGSGDVQHR